MIYTPNMHIMKTDMKLPIFLIIRTLIPPKKYRQVAVFSSYFSLFYGTTGPTNSAFTLKVISFSAYTSEVAPSGNLTFTV